MATVEQQAALYKRLATDLEAAADRAIYAMREAGLEPSAPALREAVTEHLFYAFCDELEGADNRRFTDLVNGEPPPAARIEGGTK